jgi:HPt (histidine-containing phosphotransfer) domain-containing protein
MNLKVLAKNLELEENEFLELVSLFLKTSSSDLNKLQAVIEKGNAPKVAGLAHSVKGAAATLGLTEIFEYARDMETKAQANDLTGATQGVENIKEVLGRIAQGLNNERKSKN